MKTHILFNESLGKYSFGKGHPLTADRFDAFFRFFRERFAPYMDRFEIVDARPAGDDLIGLVHSTRYMDAIRRASAGEEIADQLDYVSVDNLSAETGRIPLGIDEASRLIVGCSVAAAEAVAEDRCEKAIAFGGMHHAHRDKGEGFCFYNDVAIAAMHLKQKYGMKRVLVLDTDAHGGNGTMKTFYEDPEVLLIDIHQDPRTIYPEIGFAREIGSGKGTGFTVNVPLPTVAGIDAYTYTFDELVLPLAEEFRPQAIIRNGGSDPHYMDALTRLGLRISGLRTIGAKVRELAAQVTGGRSVDLILSGYTMNVLPHAWSAMIAGLLDLDVDLGDFKERNAPPDGSAYEVTKDIVADLRSRLRPYWKCMG